MIAKHRSIFRAIILTIILSLSLNLIPLPALAVNADNNIQTTFSNNNQIISNDSLDASTSETNEEKFLTMSEMCSLLWNTFDGSPTDNPVKSCWEAGWISGWTGDMCCRSDKQFVIHIYKGVFNSALLQALGVQIWDSNFYHTPSSPLIPQIEYKFNIAKNWGIYSESEDIYDYITYPEAVAIIQKTMQNKNRYITPMPEVLRGIKWEKANWNEQSLLSGLNLLPKSIRQKFIDEGWTLSTNYQQIIDFKNRSGKTNVAGYTSSLGKIIVTSESTRVLLHEFGHFYDFSVNFSKNHKELYEQEAKKASSILGEYSTTTDMEFFAEFFAYYHLYKDFHEKIDELKKCAPETFAVIEKLDAEGWKC